MTIKTLAARGVPKREIGRTLSLSLSEGTVRYHLRRMAGDARDGRARQRRRAAEVAEPIDWWLSQPDGGRNLAALHDWLVAEHGYAGSLCSVQRYVAEHYPAPPRRARRRVETPPGAQAQVDWASSPGVVLGGEQMTLHASTCCCWVSSNRLPIGSNG